MDLEREHRQNNHLSLGVILSTITPDREARMLFRKVGVVIFVFNQQGKILLVKENRPNSDTNKQVGDYGVICETAEIDEDWAHTAVRGLQEELGLAEEDLSRSFRINTTNCFMGETLFLEGVLARVVGVHLVEEDVVSEGQFGDGEVSVAGWVTSESLLNLPLRVGVRNVAQTVLSRGLLQEASRISGELLPLTVDNLQSIDR